jgi:hypothetical protein
MVEIQVREHDVAHVARVVAQARDLADRGQFLAELGPQQEQEESAQAAGRVGDVVQAVAGIDEHQRARRLDQQAVAHQAAAQRAEAAAVHERAAQRAAGNAIQVVDAHGAAAASRMPGAALARQKPVISMGFL